MINPLSCPSIFNPVRTSIHLHLKIARVRSFSWSAFSRIRNEYRDLLCKSQYSVRIWGNIDQKKFRTWTFSYSAISILSFIFY